ncbi:MAG TPA: VWA domain-containing protein [Isosphaeraceae bacterium]|nr:VWA domain-containing protein [Isosphaeraceae bacterium]
MTVLNVVFKPHRTSLKSGTAEDQKLFAMLKLIPKEEAARARPPLAFALVIDTSGSMQEFADQQRAGDLIRDRGLPSQVQHSGDGTRQGVNLPLPTKLDQAIEAARALVDDERLVPEDRVAVIHFDDDAKTLLPLTPLSQKQAIYAAIDSLRQFSGGTHIAKGLKCGLRELGGLPPQTTKRVMLLTDGQTFDEDECRPLAARLAESNVPIVAIGVGLEYNEELLRDLAQISQGRPYHIAQMGELRDLIYGEVGSSVREVVTDLQATVSTVKGVRLEGITQVDPSLSEVTTDKQPFRLGNVPAGDFTILVLEFTLSGFERPPSRVRIAQLGLVGHVPGLGRRDELPPLDLYVNFTTDEAAVAAVDAEVLSYVQQKNVDRMVQEAVRVAGTDAGRARQTLQAAVGMTQRLGNSAMTKVLQNALDELNRGGTISVGTRKTMALGGRTRTIKAGATSPMEGLPPNEDIRKLTGA